MDGKDSRKRIPKCFIGATKIISRFPSRKTFLSSLSTPYTRLEKGDEEEGKNDFQYPTTMKKRDEKRKRLDTELFSPNSSLSRSVHPYT